MALIRFSNLVNDIRGSSGGNTFSRGLAGATVSAKRFNKPFPRPRVSAPTVRFGSVASQWRGLSPSVRSAWDGFASVQSFSNRLGMFRTGTGFEMFSRYSFYLAQNGQSFTGSPSIVSGLPAVGRLAATYKASTLRFAYTVGSQVAFAGSGLLFYSPIGLESQPSLSRGGFSLFGPIGSAFLTLSNFDFSALVSRLPLLTTRVGGSFRLKVVIIPEEPNGTFREGIIEVTIIP